MSLGVVLIGRNEGARLERALAALEGVEARIVYVDSGSTDGSVAAARAAGAEVVELDASRPFTAARARNAGFAQLERGDAPEHVQFIDGDCALVDGWLDAGQAALRADPDLGLVTGWRSEIRPEASLYNALADVEWHRPAGPIEVCGGDMMVRAAAFRQIGGFDARVIAAEDDEFCLRLGQAGWTLRRLPQEMTRHDLAMTRFGAWWRRAVRAGHGFAQVGAMHPGHFRAERRRAWINAISAAALLAGFVAGVWWLAALAGAFFALSYLRTTQGLVRRGQPLHRALPLAALLVLSKFPNLVGMLAYHVRARRGADTELIEYK
ncbi:glycosyltransferase family 2 protein [Rhodosalinus halophilus]|uniref:Glycosyltransferase family 2 protein n=1 Tax=Rhodosalinus halophilus TaxID=2259333 RepID=A0A365U8S2_9RHOB|nr:glycosyltransferase family 2 protein [Rhodosalinus halophilus]RBI85442.1 glycosyltransferase family 2 protein [Rhodosalinus halophilus]